MTSTKLTNYVSILCHINNNEQTTSMYLASHNITQCTVSLLLLFLPSHTYVYLTLSCISFFISVFRFLLSWNDKRDESIYNCPYLWASSKTDCSHYTEISLLSTKTKFYPIFCLKFNFIRRWIIGDHQCGFRRNR